MAIYRNIFESGEVPGGITNDSAVNDHDPSVVSASLWTADNVGEVFLESDGEALEYLARHDFDGDEAAAALYQELGFGKGNQTTRVSRYISLCLTFFHLRCVIAVAVAVAVAAIVPFMVGLQRAC